MRRRVTMPSDRALLHLREIGMSHAEIAQMYGLGRSTVTKRLLAIDQAAKCETTVMETIVISTKK